MRHQLLQSLTFNDTLNAASQTHTAEFTQCFCGFAAWVSGGGDWGEITIRRYLLIPELLWISRLTRRKACCVFNE